MFIWFQGVNIPSRYFYFSQIAIYILKIHLSTWNFDYMIPKGISHTLVQNPTYEFQKRNISSFQENISSIQNYQGLSFLPVTFTGLADLFPQLESWHEQLCGDYLYLTLIVQWQNTCISCRGYWVQILGVNFTIFSWWHLWGPWFKSGFHNSFWDYLVPDRISWMTLEIYKWNWGTSFG